LDLVTAALTGELPEPERSRLVEHARTCSICRLARESLDELHRLRTRRRTQRAVAGSVALALAASLVLFMRPTLTAPIEAVPPQLTPKGAPAAQRVTLEVAVRRGSAEWVAEPGDQLQAGDLVGFVYTAPRPVHLAVAYVDAEREIIWLYPSGGTPPPALPAAVGAALPDAGQLSEDTGCAWFVTAWSDEAFGLGPVEQAIRQAKTDSACGMNLTAPTPLEAMVLPVRRSP
jgi:hypothetical protein